MTEAPQEPKVSEWVRKNTDRCVVARAILDLALERMRQERAKVAASSGT